MGKPETILHSDSSQYLSHPQNSDMEKTYLRSHMSTALFGWSLSHPRAQQFIERTHRTQKSHFIHNYILLKKRIQVTTMKGKRYIRRRPGKMRHGATCCSLPVECVESAYFSSCHVWQHGMSIANQESLRVLGPRFPLGVDHLNMADCLCG